MSLTLRLKKLLRSIYPHPGERLLRALRSRRLEQESRPLTLPDGRSIEGLKPMEAYNEFKDIFLKGIYRFESSKEKPRILDGGAYVGLSTLYFHGQYPHARITAFECDPNILNTLKANLQRNGASDVEVVEAALSHREGELSFYASGDDAGSLVAQEGEAITVKTRRLGDWLDEEIDFLKLNIEGAEMDVLRDCGDQLKQVREMVIEFHSFSDHPQRLQELLETLSQQGFRYLVNHYDQDSNFACEPPFHMDASTSFVLLVYARQEKLFTSP